MKEKNQNIEMLRAVACVMVIVIHITNYFNRAFGNISQGEYVVAVICNALARVSVPCFFMITGALLLQRQDTIRQSLKRALRVLIVLVAWSVIYYFFNVYYMNTPVQLTKVLTEPVEAHLWYLYELIPIYIILPFLQWVCRNMKPWMENMVLYGWMGITIVSTIWTALGRGSGVYAEVQVAFNQIFYLFVGYIILKYKEKILGKTKLWFGLYVAFCIGNAMLTCYFSYMTGEHEGRFFQYRSALLMFAAMCLFVCMLKNEHVWKAKYLSVFCECSFGIYVMHILFLDIFKKYVKAYQVSAYWAVPVLTVCIVIVTWTSIWFLRKWKFGRTIS